MLDDLKLIKKYYGEEMMHLCRELFPTLLETSGLLFNLIDTNFQRSRFLYEDIISQNMKTKFKDYIFSLVNNNISLVETNKTPFELMEEAGYILYECKSEEDIQKFRKYYKSDEVICTLDGGRLNDCYVFFAVKKNVDSILRDNFKNPKRQDEYGTSVISIQFTKGEVNTLSIKNRYNHIVCNSDSTFSNNLDNIIPGLTYSFVNLYNFNINQNNNCGFELDGYVLANDGKYYRYNYEINGVYYCSNNLIIDNNFNVITVFNEYKERYIIFDYYILDLKEKTIYLTEWVKNDAFVDGLSNIESINIVKDINGNKIIKIKLKYSDNIVIVQLDKYNRIIKYINNNLIFIKNNFMYRNKTLRELKLDNVKYIGSYFLNVNNSLEFLTLNGVEIIGDAFMEHNTSLVQLDVPNLREYGYLFLEKNNNLKDMNKRVKK